AVPHAAKTWATNRRGETLIAFVPKVLASADIRCWGHGPPVGREQHRLDVFRSNYAKRRTGEAGMPLQSFKCYFDLGDIVGSSFLLLNLPPFVLVLGARRGNGGEGGLRFRT